MLGKAAVVHSVCDWPANKVWSIGKQLKEGDVDFRDYDIRRRGRRRPTLKYIAEEEEKSPQPKRSC